jgi:hypothetical protein
MKKVVAGILGVLLLGPATGLRAVGEKGTILFEYWDGLTGDIAGVDSLVNDLRWPGNPSAEEWRTRLEGPTDRADLYGTRVRGYLYPPQTGDFTFWIASDDASELWLSTSEAPGSAARIAYVNGYTAARNWTTFSSQRSASRRLEAGKRYYIEVRHVDAGGSDNLAVAWFGPGVPGASATRPVVIEGKYLASVIRDADRLASGPSPADGSDGLRPETPVLQWTPGFAAAYHDVYVGQEPNQLRFRGRQVPAAVLLDAGLVPGQTYFWRVDEVETDAGTLHQGHVWSFTVWPNTASRPSPSEGAADVLTDARLAWRSGLSGVIHFVYAGTDRAAVEAATENSVELRTVTFGSETTYAPDPALQEGATIYWRVDESDVSGAAFFKGRIWSFKTFASEPADQLVGYWKLEESEGTRVPDYSGRANHGELVNGPVQVAGAIGGALQFDGKSQYVRVAHSELFDLQNLTLSAWIRPQALADGCGIIAAGTTANPYALQVWSDGAIRFTANSAGVAEGIGSGSWNSSPGLLWPDRWQYVAVTYDGSKITFYHNGLKADEVIQSLRLGSLAEPVTLGADLAAGGGYFQGSLDDVRIYGRALTAEDLALVMRGNPRLAWNPYPVSAGQADVELAGLTWTAGAEAVSHDVYLGRDAEAVALADATDSTGVYRGRQDSDRCALAPGSLAVGQTYAWRVDEVAADGTVTVGPVWGFQVADCLIVDDFEGYSADQDSGRAVYQTWADGYGGNGTGSTAGDLTPPYVTAFPVADGLQALPLLYDNTGDFHDLNGNTVYVAYSEISRQWTSPQDWTRRGSRALSLRFYGDGANTLTDLDALYVAVDDGSAATAVVRYTGPSSSLRQAWWHEWNIDLKSFEDVDLSHIKTLTLGVGDRNPTKTQAGGKGRLVIDAIRLYGARCVPGLSDLPGDLNGDCVVDWKDLRTLANSWLVAGEYVLPKDPGKASGWWKLDGSVVESYSGIAGRLSGPSVIPGVDGQAVQFSADDDSIELGAKAGEVISTLTSFTISIWASPDMVGGGGQRLFDLGNSDVDYLMVSLCRASVAGSGPRFGMRVAGQAEQSADSVERLTGAEWNHVVATLDASTSIGALYINGRLVAQNGGMTFRPRDLGVTLTNYLGKSHSEADAPYRGSLDDFRIYNRALTLPEIMWLARASATYRFEGNVGRCDLNTDGVIDGRDFAILAGSWMTEQLWP